MKHEKNLAIKTFFLKLEEGIEINCSNFLSFWPITTYCFTVKTNFDYIFFIFIFFYLSILFDFLSFQCLSLSLPAPLSIYLYLSFFLSLSPSLYLFLSLFFPRPLICYQIYKRTLFTVPGKNIR